METGSGDAHHRAPRGRGLHPMVELPKRGNKMPMFFWVCFLGGASVGLAYTVVRLRTENSPADTGPAHVAGAASPQEVPQNPPDITMTDLGDGVFHLDFGGEYCETADCVKYAVGLVREQAPGRRIACMEPFGTYGSPTTMVVVTESVP